MPPKHCVCDFSSMLHAIAGLASRAPRRIIAAALLIMVAAAIYGVPVTNSLSNGGFRDPTSQSWRASELLADKFDTGDMQMVVAVTSQTGVHGARRGCGRTRHRRAVAGIALRRTACNRRGPHPLRRRRPW